MSALRLTVIALLAVSAVEAAGSEEAANAAANPVRRVVQMLQRMQKQVTAEGEKEADLYANFECYCKNSGNDLDTSIAAASTKAPQLESGINKAENTKGQLTEDVKQHRADREAAKAATAEADEIREKQAAAFAASKADYEANLKALAAAITAVTKGMAGSFVQTNEAQALRHFMRSRQDLDDTDRQDVLSFLSGSQSAGYAPQAGEVNGILKQIHDRMEAELADLTAEEEAAIKSYNALTAAKKKQVAVLSASIEEKLERVAQLGVDIETMKNDHADTVEALAEDKKFLEDLKKSCGNKEQEWAERQKTRAQELKALAETIKVLNDDDALELFKKTLPSPGALLVQVKTNMKVLAQEATRVIQRLPRADKRGTRPELDFLAIALRGSKMNFDKVIAMIDGMVAALHSEQGQDDEKKAYCAKAFDNADDKKKSLERSIAGLKAAIEDAEDGLATTNDEIAALTAGIQALDKEVAEATKQREAEHAEFTDLMANDSAAKELLEFAKNRLNKFYNPELYIPPPERQLTEEERITENLGGSVPTEAPGGIAGTGIAVLTQIQRDAPPPPPETFGAYGTKSEENTGVIAMIDLLVKDLDKEMTEAKTEEEHAQADYEGMMKDSAAKRTMDSKALTEKESTKAKLETTLAEDGDEKGAAEKDLNAVLKSIQALHGECDWLVQYFDMRKDARANEVDQLKRAKAILSGADYSML